MPASENQRSTGSNLIRRPTISVNSRKLPNTTLVMRAVVRASWDEVDMPSTAVTTVRHKNSQAALDMEGFLRKPSVQLRARPECFGPGARAIAGWPSSPPIADVVADDAARAGGSARCHRYRSTENETSPVRPGRRY